MERFPDAQTPAWFSSDGSPPNPVQNPEYFITNPNSDFNRCDFVGTWPYSEQGSGFQEYNYQYHSAWTGANKATWNLVVTHPGSYDVLTTWVADPSNASNAKYTIKHADGQAAVVVDQRTTAGINPLGIYSFNKGSYQVTLTDGANGRVIATAPFPPRRIGQGEVAA